jgi:DNA-binding beta-propeller fold protein YncE
MAYGSIAPYARTCLLVAGLLVSPATFAQTNPYTEVGDWLQAPEDRPMGAASSVYTDRDGNVWVAERCGQNSCIDRDDFSPIHVYDRNGRWIKSFGKGLLAWPHGIYVDADGNVWVTDAGADGRRGHQVIKLTPDGEELMRLGQAGVAGSGPHQFDGPTDVVVAPTGEIFVSDGHEPESNNRVLKFTADGELITTWGGTGSGSGQFRVPHMLAMDSAGRLFVADRSNGRIQIFDQDGNYIDEWRQFGRATGLYIGANDTIYVSDNQSDATRNPGWIRGIRVGDATDGTVDAFIPVPNFDPSISAAIGAHGIAANAAGEIFGAEVGATTVRKYVRR